MPDRAFDAGRRNCRLDPAAEVDIVDHFRPSELPRIAEGQPFVGVFLLPTVPDDLAKQAVIVANAVAVGGNPQRPHPLHETYAHPTAAPIPDCPVRLNPSQ